jgi:hypothetical protein
VPGIDAMDFVERFGLGQHLDHPPVIEHEAAGMQLVMNVCRWRTA